VTAQMINCTLNYYHFSLCT